MAHLLKLAAALTALTAVTALAVAAPAAARTGAARALLDEMNRVRAAHGVAPLRLDTPLDRAARSHAADMLRRGYFAHGAVASRLRSFGARGPVFGENLAWGVGPHGAAGSIVSQWLASPPHRANVLRPGFRRVGIGVVVGRFAGHGRAHVVTATFAGR